MRVPIRWLNDYVKVDDINIKELADLFLGIGFEVEEIINTSDCYNNIVTGKILSITKHENTDKLDIVSLNIGEKTVTIVTGAKNISTADIVPVALSGAVVSGGKLIQNTDFRGVMSEGMLCSGKELDIDDNTISGAEVDGILILPKSTKVGVSIATALDIDQYIFDLSINSNRPDCNSIFNLAKEIATKLNRQIIMPSFDYKTHGKSNAPKVKIQDFNLCSRYFAHVISDVKVEKSPDHIRKRLLAAGVRPINNVVDITNFVLLEMGQPLHAFDREKISGDIFVRTALEGEKLQALNDEEYKLEKEMLVIADNNKPLSIAGVMGGKESAITDKTTTVVLEIARFAKTTVRYTSRALGLRSDSSARFERGVDFDSVDLGRLRALSLFDQLGVGKIMETCEFSDIPMPQKKVIKTSFSQLNSIIGIDVPKEEVVRILEALGFELKINDRNIAENSQNSEKKQSKSNQEIHEIECIVPLTREDIDNFADLSEEIIRFYGYEKIKSTNMENASLTRGVVPLAVSNLRKIRNVLCGAGLFEIINFSFIAGSDCEKLNLNEDDVLKNQIKIKNPLGEDKAFMRTQLVSSMLKTLQLNKNRQNDSFGLFEIAKVFLPLKNKAELPHEPYSLCIGLTGEKFDFYYLKSIISNLFDAFSLEYKIERSKKTWLHSGISADIYVGDKIVGSFGKIHPIVSKNFEASEDIFILEILLDDIISKNNDIIRVQPLPKFPCVDRDIAVIVRTETTAGEVIQAIKTASGGYLEKANLFDVYTGGQIEEGYKSMAFSLRLRSKEKTLLDAETQSIISGILENLEKNCGAKLRQQ